MRALRRALRAADAVAAAEEGGAAGLIGGGSGTGGRGGGSGGDFEDGGPSAGALHGGAPGYLGEDEAVAAAKFYRSQRTMAEGSSFGGIGGVDPGALHGGADEHFSRGGYYGAESSLVSAEHGRGMGVQRGDASGLMYEAKTAAPPQPPGGGGSGSSVRSFGSSRRKAAHAPAHLGGSGSDRASAGIGLDRGLGRDAGSVVDSAMSASLSPPRQIGGGGGGGLRRPRRSPGALGGVSDGPSTTSGAAPPMGLGRAEVPSLASGGR